jgi:hypothetical protein
MASANAQSFRFLDLPAEFPAEFRDQIYAKLLCAFGEPIPEKSPDGLGFLKSVNHSIDPRVLRVSKQVYREAYDVMLKGNRFILVRSESHLPARALMHSHQVPIVTALQPSVRHFEGYLLDVVLSSKVDFAHMTTHLPQHDLCAPCSIMILAKDLEPFFRSLECGDEHFEGFSAAVSRTITVGLSLHLARPTFEAPLHGFLNEATVEGLLLPFRTHIRGFKIVTIHDSGRPALVATVQRELAQDRWTDPAEAINQPSSLKKRGNEIYNAGDLVDAHDYWSDTLSTILRMRRGSSWEPLVAKGDQNFVNKVAKTCFLFCLNTAHVALTYWGPFLGRPGLSEEARSCGFKVVEDASDDDAHDDVANYGGQRSTPVILEALDVSLDAYQQLLEHGNHVRRVGPAIRSVSDCTNCLQGSVLTHNENFSGDRACRNLLT